MLDMGDNLKITKFFTIYIRKKKANIEYVDTRSLNLAKTATVVSTDRTTVFQHS